MNAAAKKIGGDWIRFGLIIAFIAAQNFLDTRYVTSGAYAKDQEKNEASLAAIQASVNSTSTAITLLQDQTKLLADHELRIRAIERGTPASALVVPSPAELLLTLSSLHLE